MEIIHLILGKANPNRMNGVNKVVYQMAMKQTLLGMKVAVYGIAENLEMNFGIRTFETQLFLKEKNPFSINPLLKEALLNKKNKAIVHFHGGWIPVFYSLSKFLKQHNIKYVITPHGAYNKIAMNKSFWIKKIYFNFFEKNILINAEKIHSIGASEVNGLSSIFPNNKSILLPYGYENNNLVTEIGEKNKEIIFGFIGRLDIYTKGLDTLVKAFAKFNKKIPNSKLWIIGDSDQKKELKKLIAKNNAIENIVLFGSKFGEEKNNILNIIDIFVHPSRNEGLPTSVIEAASFGKPCLVSEATNIADKIIKYKAGTSISKQNINELTAALIEMYSVWTDDEHYKEYCQNAITMVNENYCWKNVIANLNQKLYEINDI